MAYKAYNMECLLCMFHAFRAFVLSLFFYNDHRNQSHPVYNRLKSDVAWSDNRKAGDYTFAKVSISVGVGFDSYHETTFL